MKPKQITLLAFIKFLIVIFTKHSQKENKEKVKETYRVTIKNL